jgi:hypothetical protein
MAAGVLFEDHVILTDRFRFFLGRQRGFGHRGQCGPLGLLGRDGSLGRATLAGSSVTTLVGYLLRARTARARATGCLGVGARETGQIGRTVRLTGCGDLQRLRYLGRRGDLGDRRCLR